MTIPQDPHSVDPYISNVPPKQPEQTSTTAPSENKTVSGYKDSLGTFSATESISIQNTKAAPQLESPETSLLNFFKTLNRASLELRHQLSASELADQESRKLGTKRAILDAATIEELFEERKNAVEKLEGDTKALIDELNKKLEEMKDQTVDMQKMIDEMNDYNNLEHNQQQMLALAYMNYKENLKAMGAIYKGNGEFEIPPGKHEQYNYYTQQYQKAVENYNGFWQDRQTQINQYNAAVLEYNKKAAENNAYIKDFIEKNHLSDFINESGMVFFVQTPAQFRDLTGYIDKLTPPSLINSSPASIATNPPPDYFSNRDPIQVPSIREFVPINSIKLFDGLFNELYKIKITPLHEKINNYLSYWSSLSINRMIFQLPDNIPDPLLNIKPLASKILPDSIINVHSKNIYEQATGSAITSLGLGNGIDDILGNKLFQQEIRELLINQTEDKNTSKIKEGMSVDKINQAADRLLMLSVGLLSNQSLQALFPSLTLISPQLESLPKDSPAFSILFAISFVNRLLENSSLGITDDAVKTFLENSDLPPLSEEVIKKLSSILNLGQLLVAAKLLENNLGLPGLLTQQLPALLPSLDTNKIFSQAAQEGEQSLSQLQSELTNHFIEKGYPQEEAQFLSEIGSRIAERGILTPSAPSVNSSQLFDKSILVDSVKASLILGKYPLNEADTIAHEAIDTTLNEGPYRTTQQFRSSLEFHLRDLGLHDTSIEIARQAIIIPPKEESLSLATLAPSPSPITPISPPVTPTAAPAPISSVTPTAAPAPISSVTPTAAPIPPSPTPSITPTALSPSTSIPPSETPPISEGALSSTPIPKKPLSPTELMAILEKRSLQLLVPQLGTQLAKQVTEEIAKTLFGQPHPDSKDVADVKSSFSLINVIKNQIQNLKTEENQEWTEAVAATFKESIKTMISFYPFSLKMMDPAYLFIYSSDSGIIYSDQRKKALDIQI